MTILRISKRFVPLEQVAFVERFDSSNAADIQPAEDRNTRIVLINGDSIFTEATVEEFVQEHGFNYLAADSIALNGAQVFFAVAEVDAPDVALLQSFQARLTWRAPDGTEVIRLLRTPPALVAAMMTGPNSSDRGRMFKPSRPASSPKIILKAGRPSPDA